MSPEALSKKPNEINLEASDMWSFAVLLWELATREVPFADLSPMECGMKVTSNVLALATFATANNVSIFISITAYEFKKSGHISKPFVCRLPWKICVSASRLASLYIWLN